jgi:prevent-host-death family protein
MVISRRLMTMSSGRNRWSVASAKAELSRVVEDAQARPQIIERRGTPVAVVVAIDQFEDGTSGARLQRFLAMSAEIRESGGGEIRVSKRTRRASPLGRA